LDIKKHCTVGTVKLHPLFENGAKLGVGHSDIVIWLTRRLSEKRGLGFIPIEGNTVDVDVVGSEFFIGIGSSGRGAKEMAELFNSCRVVGGGTSKSRGQNEQLLVMIDFSDIEVLQIKSGKLFLWCFEGRDSLLERLEKQGIVGFGGETGGTILFGRRGGEMFCGFVLGDTEFIFGHLLSFLFGGVGLITNSDGGLFRLSTAGGGSRIGLGGRSGFLRSRGTGGFAINASN
jgi:hypothetical protein